MHYSNIVIVPQDRGYIDVEIAIAMGPNEDKGGFWNFYQVGGLWTGYFTGYDPTKDPVNMEPCWLCGSTGRRDGNVGNVCNGCDGSGKRSKWPTKWARYAGDVIPVSSLTQAHIYGVFRVIVAGVGIFGGEEYHPENPLGSMFIPKNDKPTLEQIKEKTGYVAVIVDNHN